ALPASVLTPAFRRLAVMKGRAGPAAHAALVGRMSVRVPTQGALPPAAAQILTVARARTRLTGGVHPPIDIGTHPPIADPTVAPLPGPGVPHLPPGGPGTHVPPATPPGHPPPVIDARTVEIRDGVRALNLRTPRAVDVVRQKAFAVIAVSQSVTTDL